MVYIKCTRIPSTSQNALDVTLSLLEHDWTFSIEEVHPQQLSEGLVFRRIVVNEESSKKVLEDLSGSWLIQQHILLSFMVAFSTCVLRSPNFLDMRWAILRAGPMMGFLIQVSASTWLMAPLPCLPELPYFPDEDVARQGLREMFIIPTM